MNVVVHFPKKPEHIAALRERVAVVHAQAILQRLQKISCPKEQKLQIIREIKQSLAGEN